MTEMNVNGLPMLSLLASLMERKRWIHPGDELLRQVIPFLLDPVLFLSSIEQMNRESSGHLADDPSFSLTMHECRGRYLTEIVDLPWRDVDRSFLIAVNRHIGDDVAIALDFRFNRTNPRVIATEWIDGFGCCWREVAPTFPDFAGKLGLIDPSRGGMVG